MGLRLITSAGWFLVYILVLSCPHPARSQQPDNIAETRETIVEVRLRDQVVVASDMTVWERDGDLWLPLSTIFAVLSFDIEVHDDGTLVGRLSAQDTFEIQPLTPSVEIAGQPYPVLADEFLKIEGEMFVAAGALKRWFALDSQWDSKRLILNFDPPYALPNEQAMLRARRGVQLNARQRTRIDTSNFKVIKPNYRLLGWPTVDVNATLHRGRGASRGVDGVASLLARGDFLTMQGRLAFSTDFRETPNARLTMERQDYEGGLLGPLSASRFALGDVVTGSQPLISRSSTGLGVVVSNRDAEFQLIDEGEVIGDAPPGWQAELRRGGAAIAFGIVGGDGRYRFQPELNVGPNYFTVHLFGPNGEERVVEQVVDNLPISAAVGRFKYDLSIVRTGTTLLEPIIGNSEASEFAIDAAGSAHSTLATANLEYGILPSLSVRSLFSLDTSKTETALFAGSGFSASVGSIYTDGLIIASGGSAVAARANLRGRSGRFGWRFTNEHFGKGFESDYLGVSSSALRNRWSAGIDWRVARWSFGLSGSSSSYDERQSNWSLATRASGPVGPFLAAQRINVTGGGTQTIANGSTIIRGKFREFQMRAGADYSYRQGSFHLNKLVAQASKRIDRHFLRLAWERDFRSDDNRFRLNSSHDFRGIRLGSVFEQSSKNGFYAGVTIGLSLARDPLDGTLLVGNAVRRNRGALRARFFHDQDGDGERDDIEPFIRGPRLRTLNGRADATEGEEASVLSVYGRRPTAVLVDLTELDDPFLATVEDGYLVQTSPGSIADLTVPLRTTGQVTVIVTNSEGEGLANVTVVLSSCSGKSRLVAVTFDDGTAYFDGVIAGCHSVKTQDATMEKVFLATGQSTKVELSPGSSETTLE